MDMPSLPGQPEHLDAPAGKGNAIKKFPAWLPGLKSRRPRLIERPVSFMQRHQILLWWLHSIYALLFGLAVMWIGSKNFDYLRIIIFHITFIWITSLFLPALSRRPWLSPKSRERMRLVINYFNRNFYQQLVFFLLPIYYASTTLGSRNTVFLVLLAISAILSTMDLVYDRYLSVRWPLAALFFMFNLFAVINVMLPVLWSVSNHRALWISGILAWCGFATLWLRYSASRVHSSWRMLGAAAFGMLMLTEFLPPYIPPAPLRLARAEFGSSIQSLSIRNPLKTLPSNGGKVVALTAIQAPMDLVEKVRHRWQLDGAPLFTSGYFPVTGGRKEGFRLWSAITWKKEFQGRKLTVDVETEGGQLIGRARLER